MTFPVPPRRPGRCCSPPCPPRRWSPLRAGRRKTLLNVSYDVSREFYKDYNAAFAAHWKKTTGADADAEPVARRQQPAGAQRGRRPGGRRHHDEPGQRHRPAGRARAADPGRLGEAPARQRLADHLGLGDPGAQGQPEADPRLERPGQARRRRDHPEPQDLGQRPLHLPRGLGLGAEERRRRRRRRRRWSSASSPTCRCSTAAAAAPPPPSRSASSATRWSPSRARCR